jgi:two-component system, LuxR family, sensor kinase FixL
MMFATSSGAAGADDKALSTTATAATVLETETLQSAILNSASFAIIATDANGIIQLFNVGAERLLGYSASDVVNKITPSDIHDPREVIARAEGLSAEFGTAIAPGFEALAFKASRGILDKYELTYIRKDGSRFPAQVSITALRDDQSGVIGYLLIGTDNSAAAELLQYTRALERSNKELDEFAYAAAHDLQAPLRVIDNTSKWLEEDLQEHLTDQTRDNMNLMRGRIRRMEKLLDDLLEYSRIGRSSNDRYAEIITGDALMGNVLAMLSPPSGFKVNVSPGVADINVRSMPLQQIMMNLIGNAIKHHEKAGGCIDTWVEDCGTHYAFAVKDDGPGIPAQFHDQIFKMFQTLKPRDQVDGSGMGLAMVRKNIEVVGGTLDLESSEGNGSTFRFTWPKQQKIEGDDI